MKSRLNRCGASFVLALMLATQPLMLGGCAARVSHVTNLPVGVSEQAVKNWYSATGAVKTIATQNAAAFTAVKELRTIGVFPNDEAYEYTVIALGRIAQINEDAVQFLQSVPNDWSKNTQQKMAAYMNEISGLLQKLNAQGVTGIKNPDSLTSVNKLIALVTESVSLVLSLMDVVHQ
jgi:hypothetical protein